MWSCDQSLVTLNFIRIWVWPLNFIPVLNLKVLNLKVKKCWGVIPTFVELTEERLVGGSFPHPEWG